MKPKDLLSAVRERHPNATKKEIVRAAFFALIEGHGTSSEQAQNLHSFAIGERGSDESEPVVSKKLSKKKRNQAQQAQSTH
ncbi:hypothetical protein F6X53_28075 [Methylobacterium soli]|uniref:Uncharacterized protein n=2 Tax=Methylobacterium soli TaxID=553447 RepID=A0A6L3SPX1_9HYPH|nr:hypothetical protein F6X53_28075 [Methylobacterium soli]